MTTADVIHSFWVPALGGKVDMVPGRVRHLRINCPSQGCIAVSARNFAAISTRRWRCMWLPLRPKSSIDGLLRKLRLRSGDGARSAASGCSPSFAATRATPSAASPRPGAWPGPDARREPVLYRRGRADGAGGHFGRGSLMFSASNLARGCLASITSTTIARRLGGVSGWTEVTAPANIDLPSSLPRPRGS